MIRSSTPILAYGGGKKRGMTPTTNRKRNSIYALLVLTLGSKLAAAAVT
jgi:hypothetical protein